jgi:flagellin
MSLGVLNNLSAMSAANNLNNTNNALSKTLQQLSSGSKINSGADDAAGLSLVSGLQANQTALAQSQTNAQEGSGLLQVADGALSQVTNLLNRAVTLATEVSNGTLNTSQQSAANQEYQSILSEVNNIGSTTTYNQRQVFNSTTSIYTGDSSSASASIDKLSISGLSSANVGDTGGTMAYSNGQNNVFIDLSVLNKTAALTDTLSAGGADSITVNYLTNGANGAPVTSQATISVGTGTKYADTVGGMISAINNSGLGLSATFGTAAQAGSVANAASANGGGIDTGINISAPNIGTGLTAGVIGSFVSTKTGADTASTMAGLNLAGTLSLGGNNINLATGNGGSAFTMNSLATYVNSQSWGVTASVDTSGATAIMTFKSANPATTMSTFGTSIATDTLTTPAPGAFKQTAVSASLGDTGTGASSQAGVVDTNGSSGTATISYSANAGQDLSSTNLSSQAGAQSALTQLNSAIANVAAQDGYIGAQINTLNSVSSVMSTQQQNIVAAQNAVQATDYATAASNMSKYQILSQTGISALAQANSVQQEVTKLLQ